MLNHYSNHFLLEQVRSGKINLITFIQNLSDRQNPNLPKIIFDAHNRYKILTKENFLDSSMKIFIQNQTHSELINEQWKLFSNQFNLSTNQIEYQYELIQSSRCDIPLLLQRKILLDAIEILQLIKNEYNHNYENNREKIQRLDIYIENLQIFKELFHQHC